MHPPSPSSVSHVPAAPSPSPIVPPVQIESKEKLMSLSFLFFILTLKIHISFVVCLITDFAIHVHFQVPAFPPKVSPSRPSTRNPKVSVLPPIHALPPPPPNEGMQPYFLLTLELIVFLIFSIINLTKSNTD